MELTVPLNKDPVDDLDPDDVDVMGMKKKYGAPAIGSNFGRKNWNAAEVRRKQARGGVDVCWPGAVRHTGKRAGGARKRGVTTRIVGSLANRCPASSVSSTRRCYRRCYPPTEVPPPHAPTLTPSALPHSLPVSISLYPTHRTPLTSYSRTTSR